MDINVEEESNDRISSLPDPILQHILSYIDIKLGVQTCVLSKRWKYVWLDIPSLNFTFRENGLSSYTRVRRNSMLNFTHQVLSRHSNSDINKFTFFSNIAFDSSHLKSLVENTLKRNVEIFEMNYLNKSYAYKHVVYNDPFELPHQIFTSNTLRVLKLNAHGKQSIVLPSTLSFTSLKELHLEYIQLWDFDNTSDRELIADSPNLEYLTLVHCYVGQLKSLKITATKLTKLEISSPYGSGYSGDPWICKFIVSAPNLSSFKYHFHVPLICSMGNPLNIDTVDINITKHYSTKSHNTREMGHRIAAILLEFQHAKSVTLSLRALKYLSINPDMLDANMSPFRNLKNFRVNLEDSPFARGLNYIFDNFPQANKTLETPSYAVSVSQFKQRHYLKRQRSHFLN